MRSFKSCFNTLGIVLGGIGIALCLAALILLWMASARIVQAAESLFGKADESLVVARRQVIQTQQRVAAAAITAQDVQSALRDWTKQEVGQRLAWRLDLAEKTERLSSALQQADHWLQVSQSSVGLVREIVSIITSTSTATDRTLLDPLLEEIASLRAQCAEAADFANRIHHRVKPGEENSSEDRIKQALQFALRVVATVGSIDSRLGKLADRIAGAQSNLEHTKSQSRRWILAATIAITLLILWMAAGQVAWCRLAWNGAR
jgi:hypothetical protein